MEPGLGMDAVLGLFQSMNQMLFQNSGAAAIPNPDPITYVSNVGYFVPWLGVGFSSLFSDMEKKKHVVEEVGEERR